MVRIMTVFCGILLASNALAGTLGEASATGHFIAGLSAGPAWASANQSQTFYLQEDVQKTYTADNNRSAFASAELFAGWQRALPAHFLGQAILSQVGIAISGAGRAKLAGDIWEDADPDFNNFNYTYKVQHAAVAIKGRLIGHAGRFIEPYVSGSLGVGFNRAYDFTITPKIVEEVAAPPFTSHTTTAFAYTVGAGLQKALTPQLHAAIGYEFADWGRSNLSRAAGQTLNQGLSLGHLYAQQLQLALFYIV